MHGGPEPSSESCASVPIVTSVTSVTSELEVIPGEELRRVVTTLSEAGCPTLLDDAYGSQLRPILFDGPRGLELDVDAVVANGDKAALGGPRCALVAGRAETITKIAATASMIGVDAISRILFGAA